MNKCLITRPNHDKVTNYLFHWSKEIMTNSYDREIYFLDLKGEDANKVKVESYIKKQNPRTIFFNGHGSDKEICGFKDEILIEINKNEELLKDKIVYSLSCSSAKELGKNAEIYTDVLEFIKKHDNCIIFISIDNRQYKAFNKLVGFVDGKKVVVKKESELRKGTPEYQASLVLDTLLNIERLKQ